MSESEKLSPWAHPKAQRWFETLLERSGFVEEIENKAAEPDLGWDLDQARVLLSLLVVFGRPGIWPERHRRVLHRAASKANRIAQNQSEAESEKGKGKKKALTLEQHQRTTQAKSAVALELEIVRRRAGVSNRKTPLKEPPNWGPFWK